MPETVPTTMFAWRKHKGNADPIWEEVPVPQPAASQVLVKMVASGVCRSDTSLLKNDKQASWFQEKYILGHEGCGRILQFGADASGQNNLSVGDLVALHAVPGCRNSECGECDRDLSQICEKGHHSGIGQDGFYAPYAVIDVRGAVRVPEGITPAEAAVATDAVATAYHGIYRRAEVKREETVFLFGLGDLGMNALQIVLHIGARVIVSDTRQASLDTAEAFGVPKDHLVPPGVSPQDFIRERGLENRIDTVLDFVGTHQTFEDAQHIVRRGGKILCIGSLDSDNTVHMKIGTRKRLSFIFSYGSQAQDLPHILDLIARGAIKPQVEERPYKDLPDVLDGLEKGLISARVALKHEE